MPLEAHPNAVELVRDRLSAMGCEPALLRTGAGNDGPVITESGFVVLDARFARLPVGLSDRLKSIPGVLETGIFEGFDYAVYE